MIVSRNNYLQMKSISGNQNVTRNVMKKTSTFKFCPQNWLSNPNILAMNSSQKGGYINLICLIWMDDYCSIKDDDDTLLALSGLGKESSKLDLFLIKKCLDKHPNKVGFLTSISMLEERRKQAVIRKKLIQAGRRSGVSRAVNLPSTYLQPTFNLPSITPVEACKSDDLENAIVIKIKDKIRKDKIKDKIKEKEKVNQKEKEKFDANKEDQFLSKTKELGWSDEEIQCCIEFIQDRKERKSPMTALAKKKAINILQKYKTQGMDILEVMNNSIINGWKGLFPLKNYSQGRSNGSDIKNFGQSNYRPGSAARLAEENFNFFASRASVSLESDYDPNAALPSDE
jgi:hypothetical protein